MITQERLRAILDYDPETGIFTWRRRPELSSTWNTRYAGRPAGSKTEGDYLRIGIDDRSYLAHRLAWLYVHGDLPRAEIDHRDRNRGNCRFANLWPATHAENGHNTALRRNNTSGHKGVSWSEKRKKWQAMITHEGRAIPLGRYDNIEDAIRARREAEIRYRGAA